MEKILDLIYSAIFCEEADQINMLNEKVYTNKRVGVRFGTLAGSSNIGVTKYK